MSDRSVYRLARLADCQEPDSDISPGGQFLFEIDSAVDDAISNGYTDEDTRHEIADGAADPYTHVMWSEFVDLCAYQEDPTDLGADGSDMEQSARICLFIIAERLTGALFALGAEAPAE